jgi:hypothetical protein
MRWRQTQTRRWPRRPWGARTAKLSPLSWAPGRLSGLLPHVDHNEASPSPRAANCELSPRSWVPGGPSGMVSYVDQNEASPSLRVANSEIAATFAGSWEAQRGGVICRP